ncbi:MAG TPA: response regulator [Thermoanaerobaculia bacterium]
MSTKRRLALVIDDDEAMRELIQVLLESRDFEVEMVADGIHAIELTREYDVIVLDMKMPVLDGAKLADYWMLTMPHVLRRVVVLSGYSRFRAAHPNAFAVVSKPFNHNEFIKIVEECANQ